METTGIITQNDLTSTLKEHGFYLVNFNKSKMESGTYSEHGDIVRVCFKDGHVLNFYFEMSIALYSRIELSIEQAYDILMQRILV